MSRILALLGLIWAIAAGGAPARAEMEYRCLNACLNVAHKSGGECRRQCLYRASPSGGGRGEAVLSPQRQANSQVSLAGVPLTVPAESTAPAPPAPPAPAGPAPASLLPAPLLGHRPLLPPIPAELYGGAIGRGLDPAGLDVSESQSRSWVPSTGAVSANRPTTTTQLDFACLAVCSRAGYQYQYCRGQCTPPVSWVDPAALPVPPRRDRFQALLGYGP
ncbi:hypothetical protein [Phaeospirillum tilakii]|uniref:Uncharacterized protein n=1 Tax=Phaeospirillum tilakii TaxID=741673 RepID=A0ABW5CC56_9PROT